jgi:methylenetetrahydrofolate reductase (NADPH)
MHAVAPHAVPETGAASALLRDYSVEITSKDAATLAGVAGLLAPGTRIAITSLPGESLDQSIATTQAVLGHGFRPVPHIAARRIPSTSALESLLDALADIGATQELFVIAGDLDKPEGPFDDALALIRSGLPARYGAERIGIGGYPEGHPRIPTDRLWNALRDKAETIAEQGLELRIITQFGFEAGLAAAWVRRVREAGITASIRIGVPGPASAGALLRFAARCGVRASGSALRKYGMSVTRLMQSAGPETYVRDLASALARFPSGDVGLHFYPFGGLANTARWIAEAAQTTEA